MKHRNKKSVLSSGIILSVGGGIFAAIGVAFLVITLKGIIEHGISAIGIGVLVPCIFIVAFLGLGSLTLIMGGKQIYFRIRQSRAYRRGKELTARITNSKTVRLGKMQRIRYALTLSYSDGENKTFTTDYLYDINEYRYLRKLGNIKIKADGNFAAVCEPFPEDIYEIDSTYGIERAFFKQKPVAIILRLWIVFFFSAVAFLIVSFFIRKSAVTTIAIILVFSVHFPFAIPLAILLIKWLRRGK